MCMTKTWESSLTAHSPITSTPSLSASPTVTFTVLPAAFSSIPSSGRHLEPSYQYHLPGCCNSLTGPLLFLFYPSLNLWRFSPQLIFLFFKGSFWQGLIYLSLAVPCRLWDFSFMTRDWTQAHSSGSPNNWTTSSAQFSCSVMSDSLQPHEWQHARPPCPSPTPGVLSNSCPSSQWCHPAI